MYIVFKSLSLPSGRSITDDAEIVGLRQLNTITKLTLTRYPICKPTFGKVDPYLSEPFLFKKDYNSIYIDDGG